MKSVTQKIRGTPKSGGAIKRKILVGVCMAGLALFTPAAVAQDSSSTSTITPGTLPPAVQSLLPPGMTPQQALDALRAAQSQQQSNSGQQPNQQPTTQVLSAGVAPSPSAAASALEGIYKARLGAPINQFGYDLIANGGTVSAVLNGAVQDSYILGAGDEIVLTLQGQQSAIYSVRINRNGQLLFPNLPPISATGREFGDVRRDLQAAVNRAYIQTQSYVSVGQIRQITVRVVGEVSTPGVYAVTGLSSVLDALNLAGGVKKTGSLRNITIVRGGRSFQLDLYSMLLTHGATPDMTITQDDRIVVPPIGSTVAVAGDVRRPAIYELRPGSNAISERELTALGNGPQIRGIYREMVLRTRPDGKQEFVDQTDRPNAVIRDGEILFVNQAVNVSLGRISLVGSVRLPGDFALDKYRTLHDLLPSAEMLAPTPYMLLGIVERTDQKTLQRSLIPFSLLHVLQGRENMDLATGDIVHVLTRDDMRQLATTAQPNVQQTSPWAQGTLSSTAAAAQPGQAVPAPAQQATSAPAVSSASPATAPAGTTATATAGDSGLGSLAGLTSDDAAFFGRVLGDYRVDLNGAVREDGIYLVSPGTTLDEVLAAAGGLDSDADVSAFEITSTEIDNLTGKATTDRQVLNLPPSQFASVVLKPLDNIYFHHVFSNRTGGIVTVSGEVRYPGNFSILRGERLSEVLVRAGGLTSVAYPYGTVFLRQSVAERERAGFQRVADEMQQQIVAGMANTTSTAGGLTPEAFAALQGLVTEIRTQKAMGRLTVMADPSVLAVHPDHDMILEPGDTVYIPQRPSSVTVLGEVMQPGSYQFSASSSVDDYIDQAGGYGHYALESMTFIVYPDGTAESVNRSWLKFDRQAIPPGSVIYVPRDVFPTQWLPLTISIGEIIKDFALTAASIAVISTK